MTRIVSLLGKAAVERGKYPSPCGQWSQSLNEMETYLDLNKENANHKTTVKTRLPIIEMCKPSRPKKKLRAARTSTKIINCRMRLAFTGPPLCERMVEFFPPCCSLNGCIEWEAGNDNFVFGFRSSPSYRLDPSRCRLVLIGKLFRDLRSAF